MLFLQNIPSKIHHINRYCDYEDISTIAIVGGEQLTTETNFLSILNTQYWF